MDKKEAILKTVLKLADPERIERADEEFRGIKGANVITQSQKENMFSKTMATINHWMREQNFNRYDSLFWSNKDGATYLYFEEDKPVAKVTWLTMSKEGQSYHIPLFKFMGEYEFWNDNQASFWVYRSFERYLEEGVRP